MKINGQNVVGNLVAYDGCHKIYIIEDKEDEKNAKSYGYNIYGINSLIDIYENSCSLRFISNWKLNCKYVGQFDDCVIEQYGKVYEFRADDE